MEINYMDIDFSSSHWTSLEMMENYMKLRPLDRENILLHFENTIKNGYILMKEEVLIEMKDELAYFKRQYEKSKL